MVLSLDAAMQNVEVLTSGRLESLKKSVKQKNEPVAKGLLFRKSSSKYLDHSMQTKQTD